MNIRARVTNTASTRLAALIRSTDALTEIQNTLRGGCAVRPVSEDR